MLLSPRYVEPAFLLGVVFPPPSTGSWVFSWLGGAGAGHASDAGVALVVERMPRNFVRLNILLKLLPRPIRNGIHFDDPGVGWVCFHLLDVGARGPLIAAQTRDPCVEAR